MTRFTSVPLFLLVALFVLLPSGCCLFDAGTKAAPSTCRLEHVAINVPDPKAAVEWYCMNLDMKVIRKGPPPINMHFISDAECNMMLEIYHNEKAPVPDYFAMEPLTMHIAFMVEDVEATRKTLIDAGATPAGGIEVTDKGDTIAMLRDPWGVPIQFVKRAQTMYP
jgi:catechol 2,3-dioxygenase-like lactoylglutathione lyase family enzyme